MQFALRTQAYVGGLAQKLKIPPIEANIFIQTVFFFFFLFAVRSAL